MITDDFYKVLLNNLSEGVYFTDRNRVIHFWNRGAEKITGFMASEVMGKSCSENVLVHINEKGKYLCKQMCPLSATIRDGKQRTSLLYLKHKEGHRIPISVSVVPVKDKNSNIIGGVESFFDNTQMMAALNEIEELKKSALICELTGLGNRKYTEHFLSDKLEEMKWKNSKVIVLGFEIDEFDELETKFEPHILDIITKLVARTLRANMLNDDFLGRWDKKLFLAILPKMSRLEYSHNAERLCILVDRSSQSITKNKLHVTLSGGAYMANKGDTVLPVVERIAQLINQSKKIGGNCVST